MTFRLFKEPEPGVVAHTAATKAMVQRPLFNQWIGMWLEELGIALARVRFSEMSAKTVSPQANTLLDGGCDDEVASVTGAKSGGKSVTQSLR
jgi:hypothetical protein